MISAALLLVFAVTAGTWGAAMLTQSTWTTSAPRLAIAAWQALASSVLLSLLALGIALSIGFQHVRGDIARLFDLCAENLKHGYSSPGGAFLATLGLATAGVLLGRILWCAFRVSLQDRRERRARVAVLDVLGRSDIVPGVLVLDHEAPYAFCIGGKRHRVVVTSGLLATLDKREIDAVLAHEAAHLRQRHHLALVTCRALFGALAPFFPAFRAAMRHVHLFAELSADDCARRQIGARSLRSALERLAVLPSPTGAMAASGSDVEQRLRRLDDNAVTLRSHVAIFTGLAIATLVVIPLSLVAAPAVAMAWKGICLIG
ncbi:Zn-dependent protease with chaperone function [Nocardioides albertanoniae]|uniref:Zn-dependent protease with chaperone function n=1 Tax=Nocardioides albertanoniae TaxID=1175486 RepID=A0A543A8F8_9ACTN|nr:Zn-dependent protease with chaperone function [Nocardioides albertanoniae]